MLAHCASIVVDEKGRSAVKFDRGTSKCSTERCEGRVIVSVLLLVMTPGGRKERKQFNSGTIRLCAKCSKSLAGGKMPAEFKTKVSNALWAAGVEA